MNIETKTYADGTTATGPGPLPMQSPVKSPNQHEARVMGLVDDYGQWMWDAGYMDDPRGEVLVDGAADRRKEIREAFDAALTDAYAEGRKDEREALAITEGYPCTVCGTPVEKHGSYPTCASHPFTATFECGAVGVHSAAKGFVGLPCPGAECVNGCARAAKATGEAA